LWKRKDKKDTGVVNDEGQAHGALAEAMQEVEERERVGHALDGPQQRWEALGRHRQDVALCGIDEQEVLGHQQPLDAIRKLPVDWDATCAHAARAHLSGP